MKVKLLLEILKAVDPEADVLVSTVSYYERNHYEAGYEREKPQKKRRCDYRKWCSDFKRWNRKKNIN